MQAIKVLKQEMNDGIVLWENPYIITIILLNRFSIWNTVIKYYIMLYCLDHYSFLN